MPMFYFMFRLLTTLPTHQMEFDARRSTLPEWLPVGRYGAHKGSCTGCWLAGWLAAHYRGYKPALAAMASLLSAGWLLVPHLSALL
jgi:hypothetical protein